MADFATTMESVLRGKGGQPDPTALVLAASDRPSRGPGRDAFDAESLALFDRVYRVALRLTKNAADAEDLTQETYARALRGSSRFRWGTKLKAWLFTILRNLHRNRARDRSRAVVVVDSDAVERFDGATSARETAEARLLRDAESRDLRAAMESLTPTLRQTVWLRDVEGLSYAEVAARLNIPIGTVMSRLSRARELLYRRLAGGADAAPRRPR
jgi:RNA polymerase sigma-70 factor (ECF subfamily)